MPRPDWLRERRNYLGASEVAAVCGLDPFKTALDIWAVKKGLIEEAESIEADMGLLFEDPLLSYYARRHGRVITKPGTLRHPNHPWMAATPDGVADQVRDVQVKVVGRYMVERWDDGCPDYVQAQAQWELWVSGLRVADVVACLGGTGYQEYEVPRDEAAIGYLVELCGRFWRDHIEGDAMPEIDGSESARRILGARFSRPSDSMREADTDFVQMAERHHELGRAIGTAQEERDLLSNAMRLAIGNEAGLRWTGGYASWKPDKTGNRRLYVHIKE